MSRPRSRIARCVRTIACSLRWIDFYQTGRNGGWEDRPVHMGRVPDTLNSLYEMTSYQFQRVRGGLSSQMRVLRFLHNHGTITQGELQHALGIKPATMSELITRMADDGLIERAPSIRDKRAKVLKLTASGQEAFAQQAAHESRLDLFGVLTEEEEGLLEQLLWKLSDDWRTREITTDEAVE